jgi:hypothetical protein
MLPQCQPDKIEMLPLDRIRLDFQTDEYLIGEGVDDYVAAFRREDKIEPHQSIFSMARHTGWRTDSTESQQRGNLVTRGSKQK